MNLPEALERIALLEGELAAVKQGHEESQARYRAMVDHSPDAIVLHVQGRIVHVNEAALGLFRAREPGELLGLPARDLVAPECHGQLASRWDLMRREGCPAPLAEMRLLRLDGSSFLSEGMGVPVPFQGETAIQVVIRDVSAHRAAERAALEHAERARIIADALPVYIVQVDADFRYLYANRPHEALFGRSVESMLGCTVSEVLGPDNFRTVEPQLRAALSGLGMEAEHQLAMPDGRTPRYFCRTIPSQGASGRVDSCYVLAEDVTHRTQAREAEVRTATRARIAADSLPMLIAHVERGGRFLYANNAYAEAFGLTPETIGGLTLPGLLGPQYATAEPVVRVVEGGSPAGHDAEFDLPRVGLRRMRVRCLPVKDASDQVTSFYVLAEDITDRRSADPGLLESAAHIRGIMDSLPLLLAHVNADQRYLYVNRRYEELLGLPEVRILGRRVEEVVGPDIYREIRPLIAVVLSGQEVDRLVSIRLPGGGSKLLRARYFPVRGLDGAVHSFYLMAEDVTERREAEEALLRSEATFRGAFENSCVGMVLTRPDGRFFRVNRAMADMLGYGEDEMLAQSVMGITHPEDIDLSRDALRRMLHAPWEQVHLEKRYLRKNGEVVWGVVSAAPVLDSTGQVAFTVAMVQDITERKIAEERLAVSLREKEALLREVHHRVKNNLQVIVGLVQMAALRAGGGEAQAFFEQTEARVRGMALIHDMLYKSPDLARVDMGQFSRELFGQIQALYGADEVVLRCGCGSPGVLLPLNQAVPCGLVINEILTNVFRHAYQPPRQGVVACRMETDGQGQVTLTIRDQGRGLPPGYDPETSQTLGLRLIRGIVRDQLRGQVTFGGEQGTEVAVTFPLDVAPDQG